MRSALDEVQDDDSVDGLLLIDSAAHTGRFNMAVDGYLLELAATSRIPFIRLYRWKVPTISLGYFQPQEVQVEDRWAGCPRVRRLTGGGAILHDHELTYSVTIPGTHPLHTDPYQLYERVHRAIIAVIEEAGLPARLRRDRQFEQTEDGFLCFLRRDPNDVVTDVREEIPDRSNAPDKVIGSAQRRRRGTILQHGSILLRKSDLATELPGICDLCPEFDEDGFEACVGDAIASSLQIQRIVRRATENFVDLRVCQDDE